MNGDILMITTGYCMVAFSIGSNATPTILTGFTVASGILLIANSIARLYKGSEAKSE